MKGKLFKLAKNAFQISLICVTYFTIVNAEIEPKEEIEAKTTAVSKFKCLY